MSAVVWDAAIFSIQATEIKSVAFSTYTRVPKLFGIITYRIVNRICRQPLSCHKFEGGERLKGE